VAHYCYQNKRNLFKAWIENGRDSQSKCNVAIQDAQVQIVQHESIGDLQ